MTGDTQGPRPGQSWEEYARSAQQRYLDARAEVARLAARYAKLEAALAALLTYVEQLHARIPDEKPHPDSAVAEWLGEARAVLATADAPASEGACEACGGTGETLTGPNWNGAPIPETCSGCGGTGRTGGTGEGKES